MNSGGTPLLSVRAEARQLVAPDYAELDGQIEHTAGSKAEAVRSVTGSLDQLTADLAALGAVPTSNEMEKRYPGYRRAIAAAYRGQPLSLDAPLPLGESLVNDWSDDPAQIVERRSESAQLAELISGLSPRQREVVLLHYFKGNSLRSVGKRLAISPQRASQLHLSAIAKLKRDAHAAPY